MGTFAAHAPNAFLNVSARGLDQPSRRVVLSEPPNSYVAPIAEGLRHPAGVVEDYGILGSPWGFRLEGIDRPVMVWQGDTDGLVPSDWGERLAHAFPLSELTMCRDEGHFMTLERYHEIFTALRTAV